MRPNYDSSLLIWKKSDQESTKKILAELKEFVQTLNHDELTDKTKLEIKLKNFIQDHGYDNGSVLWPLRAALTGLEKSPSPFEVGSALAFGLGKEEIINRLETAIKKL